MPHIVPTLSLYLNPCQLESEILLRRSILSFKIVKNPNLYTIHLETNHLHTYNTRFREQNLPLMRKRTERYGIKGIRNQLLQSYNKLPAEVKALQPYQIPKATRMLKKKHG